MKFAKNFTNILICFLILISNFAQIYISTNISKSTEKNSKRTFTKNKTKRTKFHEQFKAMAKSGVQFHSRFTAPSSKYSQKIGLKAFNLYGQGHLIARCPHHSVLIKLIFEKRNNHILDVGFNCRRDMKNITFDEIKVPSKPIRITTEYFDQITPPNAECPAGRALSGYEFQRIGKINYFQFWCVEVKDMHDQSTISNKYFPNDASVLDPMERKALSRFLPHTDITVSLGQYTKFAINSINFSRSAPQNGGTNSDTISIQNLGALSYNFIISKVGKSKKSGTDSNFDRRDNGKHSDKVTPSSDIVENNTYGLTVPQLQLLQNILKNINKNSAGIYAATGIKLNNLTKPEQQQLLSIMYKASLIYSGTYNNGGRATGAAMPMGTLDKNGIHRNLLRPLSATEQATVVTLIKKETSTNNKPANNTNNKPSNTMDLSKPFKLETYKDKTGSTTWNNLEGLAQLNVKCKPGYALHNFELENNNGKFLFNYECFSYGYAISKDVTTHSTEWNNITEMPPAVNYLAIIAKYGMTCNSGIIAGFQLKKNPANASVRWDYTCTTGYVYNNSSNLKDLAQKSGGNGIMALTGVKVSFEQGPFGFKALSIRPLTTGSGKLNVFNWRFNWGKAMDNTDVAKIMKKRRRRF